MHACLALEPFHHALATHKIGGGGGGGWARLWGRLSEFRYTDIDTIDRKTTLHYLHIFKHDRCWDRLFTFHRFFGTDFSYAMVNFGEWNTPHTSLMCAPAPHTNLLTMIQLGAFFFQIALEIMLIPIFLRIIPARLYLASGNANYRNQSHSTLYRQHSTIQGPGISAAANPGLK